MIIFIITIILLELGFVIYLKNDNFLFTEVFLTVLLIMEILFILFRPFDFKQFQVEYNATKVIISQVQEIKDYELIDRITEINQKIEAYNGLSNNPATNIFFSKNIGNMELLPYSK